jgi:hypothetical protein
VGLASFARPEEIGLVVTDEHAPGDLIEQVRAVGIEVRVV